ncbi:MAG: slipin family protein [Planctomycetota bacterium]
MPFANLNREFAIWIGVAIFIAGLLIAFIWKKIYHWLELHFPQITIYEYQKAVRYDRGKLTGIVEPSQFRYRSSTTTINIFEMREQNLIVAGQEVLSSDALSFKISLQCRWQFTDPVKAFTVVDEYYQTLYADIQSATRTVMELMNAEQILASRSIIGGQIAMIVKEQTNRYGILILAVSVRDCMLPAPLKQLFSKVAEARQEGLAALERARGESAALRSLANAARTVQSNPGLGLLRLIQTIESNAGNKIVFDGSELLKMSQLTGKTEVSE